MIRQAVGVALLYTLLVGATPQVPGARIVVVVNVSNTITAIPRERLAKIFLREIGEWQNGQEILPVDQIDKSPARIIFARDVLNQSIAAARRYWQERIFSGSESPPPDRVTDTDVLTYVRSNPGAIGYVLEGSELGTGVKAVPVTQNGQESGTVNSHS
jgi:ABC-type phosphate transport system substrate-binding protein